MSAKRTMYFGYGSNLWLHQMQARCPTSTYEGVARLDGYRWMINDRGYANVVETASPPDFVGSIPVTNVSYGLVFSLGPEDESQLDKNEGVPVAYTKEDLMTDFWPANKDSRAVDVTTQPEKFKLLVYINRHLTIDGVSKEEYVYRMNMGIADAVRQGVPQAYVDRTLRQFIAETGYESAREVAERQALEFRDET